MRALCEAQWEHLHPILDDLDDSGLPPLRTNAVAMFCDQTDTDFPQRAAIYEDILRVHVVEARGPGRFTFRDIQVARGELAAEDPLAADEESATSSANLGAVQAAFTEADQDMVTGNLEAVQSAAEDLKAIQAIFVDAMDFTIAPDFSTVTGLLSDIASTIGEYAGIAVEGEETEEAEESGGGDGPRISGQVSNRADAILAIDRVVEYFQKNEPSSPVPILLGRAKKLIAMDFMEVLRDLTPDAVDQAQHILGSPDTTEQEY
jgi:type VI secretion system protein ImpA